MGDAGTISNIADRKEEAMGGYNWMKVVDVMTKKSFGHDTW
jgi:hypothetical protein